MKHIALLGGVALVGLGLLLGAAEEGKEEGFVTIFNGKDMTGWKVAERPESFKIEGDAIVANGERAHCFYVGDDKPFKNFELKVDVMTKPNSNGGIYFHTKWQDSGWPSAGFETQVNNTFKPDPRKTGSLYRVKDVMNDSPAQDDKWWTQHVIVKDQTVTIKIDGKTVTEWTETEDAPKKLGEGTFCLQAHDPGSTVYYKNIRVKRLD